MPVECKSKILFFFFILFFTYCVWAQGKNEHYDQLAQSIVRTALVQQKGYALLKELCMVGPRLNGYNTSVQAIHWAKEQMEQLELDKVWLQPVMVPHWSRGDKEEAIIIESIKFKGKKLNIAALGGSIGTTENGITGSILEINSFEDLSTLGSRVKGKIIFYNRPLDQGKTSTFSAYAGAVNQRTKGAAEAAKYGAIATIVRSVTTKYDNIPHVGVMHYEETVLKIPAAAIGLEDADFLSNALKHEPELKVNINLSCKILQDTQSYNVIGEIRGTIFPEEVIIVAGHFDAWDKGHGAHDDGAGCIQALEVLDIFKRLEIKPKRTIRCVFFSDEEQQQRGAKVYGSYADTCAEKHIAAIESDRGAFTPRGFSIDADSAIIADIESWLPYLKKAKIDWIRKGGSGSDVSRIKKCTALIGYIPDDQRYFDFHHSDNDVFEAVHPREMELGSAAITILTYLLDEKGL